MKHARVTFLAIMAAAFAVTGCGRQAPAAMVNPGAAVRAAAKAPMRAAPADYYAPANGQTGSALLRTLKQIVSKHKELGYDLGRDVMFGSVDDLDNDDAVTCVYTARTLTKVTNRTTAFQNGKGLNAEHTWPQSKGAEGVAKSDLHHLFPTDCAANSRRSSFPFGDVTRTVWTEGGSTLGMDDKGRTVFEPRANHKGNVARALLYFFTVYGQVGSTSLENFKVEEATLIAWHAEDPVDANEVLRNDAIFGSQGNRNPFIDHPEYVKGVGQFLAGRTTRFPGLTIGE